MAVTASRLGNSPITLDWTHILRKYDPDTEQLKDAWGKLKARFNPSDVGFYDSPQQPELSQVQESQTLAELFLKRNSFTKMGLLTEEFMF